MEQKVFTIHSEPLAYGEINEKGEKKFFAEGFISTSQRDLVDDIVTDKALDQMFNQLKSRVIKLDFEHDSFRGETEVEKEINKARMPLAKAVDFTRIKDGTHNGVKVRWEFNDTWKKFDTKGDVVMDFPDIKKNVERGFYDAFSIAFVPTKSSERKSIKDGSIIRLLDGMNLLNVALTGNPINPGASIDNVFLKSLDYLKKSEGKRLHTPAHKPKPSADEDEEEESDSKKKKPKNQKEVNKVTEEETSETQTEEAKKEEGSEEAPKEEEAAAEEVVAPAESEKKSKFNLEVKSEIASMKKSIEAIEKAITKPVMKSISEQAPKNALAEEKALNPLDLL